MADPTLTGGDTSGAPTGGADGQGGTQPEPKGSNAAGSVKTFTQDEVNRIVKGKAETLAKRMADEAATQRLTEMLEERGLSIEALDDLPNAAKDVERSYKAKLTRAEKERDEYKTRLESHLSRSREAAVTETLTRAASSRTSDLEAFLALARPHLRADDDLAVSVVDGKGEARDGETVDTLVAALLEKHPSLAAPTGVPGAGSRGSRPSTAAASGEDVSKLPWDHPRRRAARLEAARSVWPGEPTK